MFVALPCALKELIVQFAFKISLSELQDDLEDLTEIKRWKIHPRFVKRRVFEKENWEFADNPLYTYMPLRHLTSGLKDMFDMWFVMDFLDKLDFRKRDVQQMGLARIGWMEFLTDSDRGWEFLSLFTVFFNVVTEDPGNLKPSYSRFFL